MLRRHYEAAAISIATAWREAVQWNTTKVLWPLPKNSEILYAARSEITAGNTVVDGLNLNGRATLNSSSRSVLKVPLLHRNLHYLLPLGSDVCALVDVGSRSCKGVIYV